MLIPRALVTTWYFYSGAINFISPTTKTPTRIQPPAGTNSDAKCRASCDSTPTCAQYVFYNSKSLQACYQWTGILALTNNPAVNLIAASKSATPITVNNYAALLQVYQLTVGPSIVNYICYSTANAGSLAEAATSCGIPTTGTLRRAIDGSVCSNSVGTFSCDLRSHFSTSCIPTYGLSSGVCSQCLSGQIPASPTSPCPAVPICPVVSSVCNQAGFVVSCNSGYGLAGASGTSNALCTKCSVGEFAKAGALACKSCISNRFQQCDPNTGYLTACGSMIGMNGSPDNPTTSCQSTQCSNGYFSDGTTPCIKCNGYGIATCSSNDGTASSCLPGFFLDHCSYCELNGQDGNCGPDRKKLHNVRSSTLI